MPEPAEQEHIVPISVYVLVFLALLALTLITTLVSFLDLGPLNTPVALLIAGTKATLVILFFMHLKYTGLLSKTVAIAVMFFFLIFIAFTLGDYLTRPWPS
ncbi:MAG: cytochrome C oxidase subunit IV family protein [Acidobacteria bacterium]|nr:cytochrome C oxidase subunit IV family protein [Acidobacteriaceae bacterium]MBV9609488.1 cytochrome C oxidase subunit IV family protein [Acidobacteriota bacterium]